MRLQQHRFVRSALVTTGAVSALALVAACSGGGGTAGAAGADGDGDAEAWQPSRATMIVTASPGGGSDLMGRTVASGIEEVADGLNISIENHPGGSTAVGYSLVLSLAGQPEYLVGAETTLSALPLSIDTPYTWEDFTPIAQVAEDALVVAVRADSEYETLADLAEATGSSTLTSGIVAAVGPDSVLLDLLATAQGVSYDPVVFEAADESNAALLAGNIDFLVNNPGESKAYVESGDMRFLATFTEDRLTDDMLTDVPTAQEQDVDVVFAQWRGVLAPGDIPEEAVTYWQDRISEWTELASYDEYIVGNDLIPKLRVGDDFRDYLADYEDTLALSITPGE